MNYIQVEIKVKREGIEPVTTALMGIDINDIMVDDPADIDDLLKKEKGYEWDYIDDSVLELQNEEPKITVFMDSEEFGVEKVDEIKEAMENLKTLAAEGVFGDGVDLGTLEVVYTE